MAEYKTHGDYVSMRKRLARRVPLFGDAAVSFPGFRAARGKGRKRNKRTGGLLGIETKFFDTTWSAVTIPVSSDATGGEIQPSVPLTANALTVPRQGDGESDRDGRSFVVKSIWASGMINYVTNQDEADAKSAPWVFLALVLDTQTNGATINSEDVFTLTNPKEVVPQPRRNLQNNKRFKVLASACYGPHGVYAQIDGASTASQNVMRNTPFNLTWKGDLKVEMGGTTSAVTNVKDNSVHLIGFSSGSSMVVNLTGKCRVRFVG